MAGSRAVPELTPAEARLLPLLTTQLSFQEMSVLLERPRADIQADAVSIYYKLGLSDRDA